MLNFLEELDGGETMGKARKRIKAYQVFEGNFLVRMSRSKVEMKKYVKSYPEERRQNMTIEPVYFYEENPFKNDDRVIFKKNKRKCGVIVGSGGYIVGLFRAYPVVFDDSDGKARMVWADDLSKEY